MEQSPTTTHAGATVAVLADDLIWASRLRAAVERAGATALAVRSPREIEGRADLEWAIVDLGGRAYDGLDAVRSVASRGARVICVAQHEDVELRRAALAAGAARVFSYNKLFSDGPAVVSRWLAGEL